MAEIKKTLSNSIKAVIRDYSAGLGIDRGILKSTKMCRLGYLGTLKPIGVVVMIE